MNHLKKNLLLLSAGLFLILIGLQACSSDPPTILSKATGVLPVFTATSTPCSGVLGTNVIETSSTTSTDIWFNPYTTSGNELVQSLSVYTSSASPVTFELGVYAANTSGTNPTILLGETGPQTIGAFTGWSTARLNSTVNLSSGVTYWLADYSTIAYYVSSTQSYGFQTAGVFGSLPTDVTSTVTVPVSKFTFSFYGTVCP